MKGKRIENLPPDYLSRLAAQKGSGREKVLTLLRLAGDFGLHSSTVRRLGLSAHPSERVRELEGQGFDIRRETDYIDGRNGVRFYLLSEPAAKLTAGISADGQALVSGGGAASERPSPTVGVDPGEQSRPTGAPSPKGADRSDKPEPVPSASEDARAGSGVTSHALEPAPRLFDDSPPSAFDPWSEAA